MQAEPAFWGAFNALGGFLFSRGKIDEAIEAYPRGDRAGAVERECPQQPRQRRCSSAATCRRGGRIPPLAGHRASPRAYSNLGTVHYFLGQFLEASANYERATALAPQDQALWGNLADATWQIPGRRDEATGHYRQAIRLGLRELESSPTNAVLVAQLGYYYGRVGEAATSLEFLARLRRRRDRMSMSAIIRRWLRPTAATSRRRGRARSAAVRLGYPEALLQADPSLAGLGLQKNDLGDEP